jgi:hypothetical protein
MSPRGDGKAGPLNDADVILKAVKCLRELGDIDEVKVAISS